ncbi:MAG: hypothetical protein ACTSXU_06545 [Promethearchaeota archaeon]
MDRDAGKKTSLKKKVIDLIIFIATFIPILLNIYFPVMVAPVEFLLFMVTVYQIDIFSMLFGDKVESDGGVFTKARARKFNFITALSCAFILFGINNFLSGVLAIFESFLQQGTMQVSFISILSGVVLLILGLYMLWKTTLKPLHFLDKEDRQVFANTIGGFQMYSAFLGLGGEKIISYLLIIIRLYYFIRSLREIRNLKDLIKKIKTSVSKGNVVEDSFWLNWANFHKAPQTRFFGTIIVITGFIFGLNSRFLGFDVIQILYTALSLVPFAIATVGLKKAWTRNAPVIFIIIIYSIILVAPISWPMIFPLVSIFSNILPDLRLVATAFVLIIAILISTSFINSIAKMIYKKPEDVVKGTTYFYISDLLLFTLMGIIFSLVYFFNILHAPLRHDVRVSITITFAFLAIFIMLVFYSLRKAFFVRNLKETIMECPKCGVPIDKSKEICQKCGQDLKSLALGIARKSKLKIPKQGRVVALILIIAMGISSVAFSSFISGTKSSVLTSTTTFRSDQYFYYNINIDGPINITFGSVVDSITCAVYDPSMTTLLESNSSSNGTKTSLTFNPGHVGRFRIVFFLMTDIDSSGDTTIEVSMQILPTPRCSCLFIIAAFIILCHTLLVNNAMKGKRARNA